MSCHITLREGLKVAALVFISIVFLGHTLSIMLVLILNNLDELREGMSVCSL